MLVNFESLDNSSKVWVYQADREFSSHEEDIISEKATIFIESWKRHGDDLKASFKIMYHQFIVLAVDENYNGISGCSIDASVNLMKQLEKAFELDLTNRLNISFRDGNNINVVKMADFQKFAKEGRITSETIVFNNMVTSKSDFESIWEVPAEQSWHKRFLTAKSV